ncbi:hypothetical protein O6H91_14G081800 [Diphasiastrum complanatum]|uniref:Uncharacterized protein n=1 Tax=Diphasiastrum complanatum TaxID=34168 RepID=A0ACC2BRB7_DIPCM|nr:hypothetical protein O6H91_14G081800 [Diphasiastrum complanatum]
MPLFIAGSLSATSQSVRMHFSVACALGSASSSSCLRSDQMFGGHTITTRAPRTHRRRVSFRMRAAQQAFFESSIVQAESDRLRTDYSAMLKLGRKYGKFDRPGKIFYIQEMKNLIERWQIFVKRMELVDDFSAKSVLTKLRTEVGPLGLSNLDLADSMYVVLDEMRKDAEAEETF